MRTIKTTRDIRIEFLTIASQLLSPDLVVPITAQSDRDGVLELALACVGRVPPDTNTAALLAQARRACAQVQWSEASTHRPAWFRVVLA